MTERKLKPCPFCGRNETDLSVDNLRNGAATITCKCLSSVVASAKEGGVNGAFRKWNTRPL